MKNLFEVYSHHGEKIDKFSFINDATAALDLMESELKKPEVIKVVLVINGKFIGQQYKPNSVLYLN